MGVASIDTRHDIKKAKSVPSLRSVIGLVFLDIILRLRMGVGVLTQTCRYPFALVWNHAFFAMRILLRTPHLYRPLPNLVQSILAARYPIALLTLASSICYLLITIYVTVSLPAPDFF